MEQTSQPYAAEIVRPQHTFAAVVACVLSVGLHLGIAIWMADFQLEIPILLREPKKESADQSMVLKEVKKSLPSPKPKPLPSRSDTGISKVDAAGKVKSLGRTPNEVAMAPPPVSADTVKGPERSVVEPKAVENRRAWEPRQEILSIKKRIAADKVGTSPRRRIPDIERVANASDIVMPVNPEKTAGAGAGAVSAFKTGLPERAPIKGETAGGGRTEIARLILDDTGVKETARSFVAEPREAITEAKAIESFLVAGVNTYSSSGDREYGYFKVDVRRAGKDVLPVMPKDIIFVQDCSASMAEQRLFFCRRGLKQCIDALGSNDRFNVAGFRDKLDLCFDSWTAKTPESVKKAKEYVDGMRSMGSTDIFKSIRELHKLPRTKGRPVIALVVTDGRSTTGLMKSSDIIGEFSKLNDGGISVFTMGTISAANMYLLDLLSYCNRGGTAPVEGGRWGIPESLERLSKEVARPVLSDVKFRFAGAGSIEVYPVLTSNLYLDRDLVLYGRYRKGTPTLVFQAAGVAGEAQSDMVFTLSLGGRAATRDKLIRENWARQKIYHLIGEYARNPTRETMLELRRTAKEYDQKIPYKGKF